MCTYNPGTIVKGRWTPIPGSEYTATFVSVFWAFAASIQDFHHCPPIICVDRTHLYSKYKGKLLIATCPDANRKIFPLAFAIVQEEILDTWNWFLCCLCTITDRDDICLKSDWHAGILTIVQRNPNW
ncbi:uncharacterized protein LOC131148891 [Malania oleifera]|uniref:uncharacterized protein LOC131148891 n=1 Tax=Malania oleifera TaxID=397392 RepID=UPI0025ADC4A3|nr:uncharacterized protein LOC131148891 [Malania oleifera]